MGLIEAHQSTNRLYTVPSRSFPPTDRSFMHILEILPVPRRLLAPLFLPESLVVGLNSSCLPPEYFLLGSLVFFADVHGENFALHNTG